MKSILEQSQRHLRWVAEWKGRLPVILLVIFLSTLLFTTPAVAAPSIVPSTLPSGQVGVSYSTALLAVPIVGTPTWTVVGGSLPPVLTLAPTTGIISGTPTIAGTYTFYVQVTDSTGTSSPQAFSITIAEEPIIFYYTYLTEAKEGITYDEEIYVTGGKPPYTFSLVSGILPSGLVLDPDDGIISGIPAKGTAGTYNIAIGVTDSSTPHLYAQQYYSLIVEKGFYEAVIKVSYTLAAGETNVYVDGTPVATLDGDETTRLTFTVDEEPVISVDTLISHPTKADVRFRANEEEIAVSELSPNATFDYTPEYYVDLKTDPSQITTLTGSNWYVEGYSLMVAAQAQVEGEAGTEYRFSYWLLPTGEKVEDEDLSWRVSAAGKVIATYDTYYELTVTSPYGTVDGSGWYKAGTAAKWSVSPTEVSMSGFLGFLQGKLEPESANGTEVMTAPETIDLVWKGNYTMPIIFIVLLVVVLGIVAFFVYRLFNPPVPKPVAPTPAPTPPTIVLIEGGQKSDLDTTREQVVEQFRQLLQKYEIEVESTIKGEELPEAKLVPEAQRLTEGKGVAVCGHTSKELLRTVVGNWHKAEEEVVPPDEKTDTKGVSIRTIWARGIYKEWEISVCSLPQGHSGNHHGTTTKGYTLQDTVTEELSYSAKQKTIPPKHHFTDELPVVDVAHHQIIPSDQDTPDNEAITPD